MSKPFRWKNVRNVKAGDTWRVEPGVPKNFYPVDREIRRVEEVSTPDYLCYRIYYMDSGWVPKETYMSFDDGDKILVG